MLGFSNRQTKRSKSLIEFNSAIEGIAVLWSSETAASHGIGETIETQYYAHFGGIDVFYGGWQVWKVTFFFFDYVEWSVQAMWFRLVIRLFGWFGAINKGFISF